MILRRFIWLIAASVTLIIGSVAAQDREMREGDAAAARGEYEQALSAWKRGFEQRIPQLRGLEFKKPVVPGFMGRAELREFIVGELENEMPPEAMEEIRLSLIALGLARDDFDPETLIPSLLTEEVAGFYDPRRKTLFLIVELPKDGKPVKEPGTLARFLGARPRFDPAEQKTILLHEMSHALMDQHYDLKNTQLSLEDDDDASLAYSSLVEGEATIMMMLPNLGGRSGLKTSSEFMERSMSMMMGAATAMGGPAMRAAPKALAESFIFPYLRGPTFILALTNPTGTWAKVNDAFVNPPLSTEHILHPEKYLAGDDPPLAVELPDLVPYLAPGWRELTRNVVGEAITELMLRERDVEESAKVAAGWGGDAYVILTHDEDDAAGFALRTVWDTVDEAREFEAAWKQVLKKGGHLERRDKGVLVIEGYPDPSPELREALWQPEFSPKKMVRRRVESF